MAADGSSLYLRDLGIPDHTAPFCQLNIDALGELLGGVADRQEAEGQELLLHVGLRHHLGDLALQEVALAKRLSPRDMAMTTFLYFEAAAHQALGQFDEAIRSADQSLMLVPGNYDSRYIRILSLVAAGRRDEAMSELGRLKEIVPPEFTPTSGWNEPFPESVAAAVTLESGMPLSGVDYNEGLIAILLDLGWRSP